MTFQEIFKEEGLYVAYSFKKGFCFRIKRNPFTNFLELDSIEYKNAKDILPSECQIKVYANLFDKEYKKVLNKNSLFI